MHVFVTFSRITSLLFIFYLVFLKFLVLQKNLKERERPTRHNISLVLVFCVGLLEVEDAFLMYKLQE